MHGPHEAWALSPAGLSSTSHRQLQSDALATETQWTVWCPAHSLHSRRWRGGDGTCEERWSASSKSSWPWRGKGTDFVVRAGNGGEGLDMDDGGRVPWRLLLSKESGKEMVGNRAIWLRCHIWGQTAQGMHLTTLSARGEDHEKHRSESEILKRNSWIGSYGARRRAERTRKRSQMEYIWGYLHPWWTLSEPGPNGEGHLTEMNRQVGGEQWKWLHDGPRLRHWKRKVFGEEHQEISNLNTKGVARAHLVVLGPAKPTKSVWGVNPLRARTTSPTACEAPNEDECHTAAGRGGREALDWHVRFLNWA